MTKDAQYEIDKTHREWSKSMQLKVKINGSEKLTLSSFRRVNINDLKELIIILRKLAYSTKGERRSDLYQLVKSVIFANNDDKITANLLNQPSGSYKVFKWEDDDPYDFRHKKHSASPQPGTTWERKPVPKTLGDIN